MKISAKNRWQTVPAAAGMILLIPVLSLILTADRATAAANGSVPAQTADLAALKAQAEREAKAGRWAAALEAQEQIVQAAEQEHYDALYEAARLHALLGHREAAYRYLDRAVAAGYYNRGQILQEEAFKDFRGEDLFRTLGRKAWANGYVGLLERSNREDVQKSPEIMKALAFKPGERVADIGAGSGYFTIPAAAAVGPTGVVWALDIAQEMIDYLGFRLKSLKIENVKQRKVLSDDPLLEPASVETILMIDTIHYVKDRVAYARKLRQGLVPGGRLVIIDYTPKPVSERPWGPPPEQQIPLSQMDADMIAAGFAVTRNYDFLPEQYFVVYTAPGKSGAIGIPSPAGEPRGTSPAAGS